VRSLAIFINASPQRRESFYNLQPKEPKLVPIQDVATRWNSTFLMLVRAKKLQQTFDAFCSQYDQEYFALNQEQWRQVDYLIYILQPFHRFTTLLSKSKDVTIHRVFKVYNKLFDHLEKSIRQLRRKRIAWKQMMLASLEAAKNKLSIYYKDTDNMDGDLYAIGTILSPQDKFQFFSTADWDPEEGGIDYRATYRQSLEASLKKYSENLAQEQQILDAPQTSTTTDEFVLACARDELPQSQGFTASSV
jgi:hypothetical protein